MARHGSQDPYATLGVTPHASPADIRLAFRRLALRHHPDRAGPGATTLFQSIAAAYAVLSNEGRRAAYDRRGAGARNETSPPPATPLPRLCGHLSTLAAAGAARVCTDGTIDLFLTAAERATGGFASISARIPITCPTCGGLADRHGFLCERCDFAGVVIELVTAWVTLPPGVLEGALFTAPIDPLGGRPLRFRVRRAPPG